MALYRTKPREVGVMYDMDTVALKSSEISRLWYDRYCKKCARHSIDNNIKVTYYVVTGADCNAVL